ncbi:hypothetical protein [Streptomyces sp. MS191]|nr:hypothetical protein [Streptomyces sp. ms191]
MDLSPLRRTRPGAGTPGFAPDLDEARADGVLPVLRLLLGHDEPEKAGR